MTCCGVYFIVPLFHLTPKSNKERCPPQTSVLPYVHVIGVHPQSTDILGTNGWKWCKQTERFFKKRRRYAQGKTCCIEGLLSCAVRFALTRWIWISLTGMFRGVPLSFPLAGQVTVQKGKSFSHAACTWAYNAAIPIDQCSVCALHKIECICPDHMWMQYFMIMREAFPPL